ncbi:MAG: protein-L-isoaspartate(D-aspartate) O-methyltransferase [Candidatus Aenigmatarchaeota archaeon]
MQSGAKLAEKKKELISFLVESGFLHTPAVIRAFEAVPREKFVPSDLRSHAYDNEPLPIGHGQTISQPLTVAVMTEHLHLRPGMRVLEVGTGSGYQAAILAKIVGKSGKVITTERIPELAKQARENLSSANIGNVAVVECDGTNGYAEAAPYDRIIVTAAAPFVPEPLVAQLKPGGKMVIPVEDELWEVRKDKSGKVSREVLGLYAFVPLVGEHGYPPERIIGG